MSDDNDGSDGSGGGYGDFLAVLRSPSGASTQNNSRAADDNNAVVDEYDVPISSNTGGGHNNYRRASMESEQTDSTKALHYSMNSEDSEIRDMTDRLSLTVSLSCCKGDVLIFLSFWRKGWVGIGGIPVCFVGSSEMLNYSVNSTVF